MFEKLKIDKPTQVGLIILLITCLFWFVPPTYVAKEYVLIITFGLMTALACVLVTVLIPVKNLVISAHQNPEWNFMRTYGRWLESFGIGILGGLAVSDKLNLALLVVIALAVLFGAYLQYADKTPPK